MLVFVSYACSLEEGGQTALGPALLMSVIQAGKTPGSKVRHASYLHFHFSFPFCSTHAYYQSHASKTPHTYSNISGVTPVLQPRVLCSCTITHLPSCTGCMLLLLINIATHAIDLCAYVT